ncbi:MAG: hypothetical protein A3F18_02940 [Legionellales bacterium RIFCSPHIGHO2_12_FULL_37_14]|nr:MAG: hypothetical protein A3F18_02940 [Legionellales bacterium RIFCSPHIGHO2_12_FULL_37_14]
MLIDPKYILALLATLFLTSCVSGIWTGANLVYDRYSVYKTLSDYKLSRAANSALFNKRGSKCPTCLIDITVFKEDVLISGHVTTQEIANTLSNRLLEVSGYRHLYNKVMVAPNALPQTLEDSWITMKVRSQIMQNSNIDPNAFKIVTTDGIVYIMGEARVEQGHAVINIARQTRGVRKVVSLVHYLVEAA